MTDETPYLFLPSYDYIKTECKNRTPEHILNDTVGTKFFVTFMSVLLNLLAWFELFVYILHELHRDTVVQKKLSF